MKKKEKKFAKDLIDKELFLYLVPVISMVLIKILDKYCDIWYYVICCGALVAQMFLYKTAKTQQTFIRKQKKNFDDAFHAKYNEEGDVSSITIDGGTF